MNSKVSLFNWNYFKQNMKKSRGVLFLFALVIPIFTYLFMLLYDTVNASEKVFPHLADLSIPVIIGMYIIPFVLAATLFSFVFRKDSVDFINALPIKRETVFLTNIIGGIGIFFAIFAVTTLLMFIMSLFFSSLVIPGAMYLHYFISFFISYCFVFVASSFALALTGSRIVHVFLVLILLFIPGFVSDFYSSRVHTDSQYGYSYVSECSAYDQKCDIYSISNDLKVGKSFTYQNGQTLPYKYISTIPRALFGMNSASNEITYQAELSNVYNTSSIIRMIVLSIMYIVLGMYAFINRRMELAETTFKNENVHQFVKCLTLFPLCLGTISVFQESGEIISLWILLAVTITIYVIYDLVTRRNSGKFMKSVISFLLLSLVSIVVYASLSFIGNLESSKVVQKDDVNSLGIMPNGTFGYETGDSSISLINYKVTDKEVIDLIFKNANKKISISDGKQFAIRTNLKNGATHYFNITLSKDDFDSMLDMLDKDSKYKDKLSDIPYNKIYGLQLGNTFITGSTADKVISLIKEGYESKSVSEIVNATYANRDGDYNISYSLTSKLYTYDDGVKVYSVNTSINPKLLNYVMQTKNMEYIEKIKSENININRLNFSISYNPNDKDQDKYYQLVDKYADEIYRYINDNISTSDDFTKYKDNELIYFNVYVITGNYRSYQVFVPRNSDFDKLVEKVKIDYSGDSKEVNQ